MEKAARYFRVIEAYQSPYPHPIIFHEGEPQIDAIFAEIEKCGQPCSQIALATE